MHKKNQTAEGKIDRYKARLITKAKTRKMHLIIMEFTHFGYCKVDHFSLAHYHWKNYIYQMNVRMIFINSYLGEVYMPNGIGFP
jgi:hypothetical protein